ncbi:MAG: DUF5060 domain-containing protein [Planctomycetes bacterium]|nr:DUF5060 domain-containing protein [Planctomycetota bacterium]
MKPMLLLKLCVIVIAASSWVAATPAQMPSVQVSGVNTDTVKKYEKFEINLELSDVEIRNPYDPHDIDLYAQFESPTGKSIRINGFYDNYQDADQWKLRFSPDVVGDWTYQVFVDDNGRTGQLSIAHFAVVDSKHHGWIQPSDKNPHYFQHDDGTSYFAIGVYSPWRNTIARLDTFAEHNANLLAIWDIGYGGMVNGAGVIEEELGRYNQEKLGRLDSFIEELEARDIKLMYAIWPHDLFSATVWAAEWDKNPYREITDVVDVYQSEAAWEYQKKKYRYLVARYSYSRSMGIWEIINEMNGTDGWAKGRHQEALDWVSKVDQWFAENDPYDHPTTASFSGGFREYREALYERNDIPNLHVYPKQGWKQRYPNDQLRSAMYNYAWASRRFWANFAKPALFGEAGADLAYFNVRQGEYHDTYHNAIWATLANGLAGIPVWWQFRHLSACDWDHLQHLAAFVSEIDFANQPYNLAAIVAEEADAFALSTDSLAFGWVRSYTNDNIGGTQIVIEGLAADSFEVSWFDTWSGTVVSTETRSVDDGKLSIVAPALPVDHPDIAFKINRSAQ